MELAGAPRGVGRTKTRVIPKKFIDKQGNERSRFIPVVYTPEKTKIEHADIRLAAMHAMGGRIPLDEPLHLKYVAYLPVPKAWSQKKQAEALASVVLPISKPDFDNIAKFVDAMKHIVFVDDSRITDAHIWKRYDVRPRIVIEIRRMSEIRA